MNESHIAAQFTDIATVTTVKLIRDKVKGTPVGYGFVEFPDFQTARDVFNALNGKPIPGSNRCFKLNWASHGGGVARAGSQFAPKTNAGMGGGQYGGNPGGGPGGQMQNNQFGQNQGGGGGSYSNNQAP